MINLEIIYNVNQMGLQVSHGYMEVENNKESYGTTIYSRHQNRCLQDNNFRQSTATMYGDRSNRLVFVHVGNGGE